MGPPTDPEDVAAVLELANTGEDMENAGQTQIVLVQEWSLLAACAKRLQELDSSTDHWRLHDALKAYVNDNQLGV
jgi:hypothetical protein